MIGDDGRLSYDVVPDARRLFRHRLRHLINPVVGVSCGLVFGAALFLIAVQALFGLRPSVVAVIVSVLAVIVYGAAVFRARQTSLREGRHRVVLDDAGVTVAYAGSTTGYPWTRFSRWLEHEDDFVLASGGVRGRKLVVLPKAGMLEEEQDLIREVLHGRIDPDNDPLDDAFVEMDYDAQPSRRRD